jgi:hypothetical protein
MPWKSKKQQAWGHTAAGQKALGGSAAVSEWDSATNFSGLPEKKMGWMQDESDREKSAGTKGKFSGAAAKAGKSTAAYAEEKKGAPGKAGQRARMALMFAKARKG